MVRIVGIIIGSFFLLLGPSWGEQVTIEIDLEGTSREDAMPAVLIARAISAAGASLPAQQTSVMVPGRAMLDLTPGVTWKIRLLDAEHWAEDVAVLPSAAEPSSIRMLAFPAGVVVGAVTMADDDEAMADHLLARFHSGATEAPDDRLGAEVRCPVSKGRWRCKLPAGTLDLRFRSRGFISHYFWDVPITRGGVKELGAIELVRGSAISGFARLDVGAPAAETAVTLFAAGVGGADSAEAVRLGRPLLQAMTNDRGFYTFDGVAAGAYALQATLEGYAPARMHPVVVEVGTTAEVWDLVLKPPVALEVFLDPPTDPFGEPWRMKLFEMSANGNDVSAIDSGDATLAGAWTHPGLAPGNYLLLIEDRESQRFASRTLEHGEQGGPVEIAIESVWLEGAVELGDEPLEARLTFRSDTGSLVVMQSDAGGQFGGYLAGEGSWDIDVQSANPSVFRRLRGQPVARAAGDLTAQLDVVIPDTLVRARVLGPDRKPRFGARVLILSEGVEERPSAVETDDDGQIALAGFPAGRYRLQAETWDGTERSPTVPITIEANQRAEPVTLVLDRLARLRGRVISESGPAIGAQVLVTPQGLRSGEPPNAAVAVTDPNGHFEVSIPPETTTVQVTVLPPGFALTVLQAPVRKGEDLTIVVERFGGQLEVVSATPIDWSGLAPQPVVFRDDIMIGASTLRSWASAQGRQQMDPNRLVVPMMASGAYQICWLPPSALFAPGGWQPGRLACMTRRLMPASSLTVEVGPADETARSQQAARSEGLGVNP